MEYEPSLDEIKRMTQEIQASWGVKKERYRRTGLRAKDSEPNPLPSYDDAVLALFGDYDVTQE